MTEKQSQELDDAAEAEVAKGIVERLLGATIVGFGRGAENEIGLLTLKGDVPMIVLIGKDKFGELVVKETRADEERVGQE
jgi:hypothetical protein